MARGRVREREGRDRRERNDGPDIAPGRRPPLADEPLLGKDGEEPAEEDRGGGEVAEARAREQVHRAEPHVRRYVERADEVPRAVEGIAPAERASPELRPRADAVPQQADRPHELEWPPATVPLREHEPGEDEAD